MVALQHFLTRVADYPHWERQTGRSLRVERPESMRLIVIRTQSASFFTAFMATWLLGCGLARAQWRDLFEGGQPRWRLVESDCQAQLTLQEISLVFPRSGRTSELMEVACTSGSMALLAYPIEPCTILEEFRPRIWTRCSSSRLQLGVRVVFPFAKHPVTGAKLTSVVWGDVYQNAGQWQALEVGDLVKRFHSEKAAIHGQLGSELRLEGAFIDSLVLNAYTGPGRYRLQIDDLELRGSVTLARLGTPPPKNWREAWRWRFASPSPESKFWSRPNIAPVWIQHRGEVLTWLNSLGFSGVVTDSVPSPEYLAQAQSLDMGVISPPPSVALEFDEAIQGSLKGWLVGTALDSQQLPFLRDQVARVSELPMDLRRPLVAEALEDYFQFSRYADEVIIPQPISASAGTQREKIDWLHEQLAVTRQRSDGWVSVNFGIPPSITTKLLQTQRVVAPEMDEKTLSVNPEGFRQQIVSSVIAGAKGFLIRTFRPLDIQDTSDSAQIASLNLVQEELRLWGPWIIAGQAIQSPSISDANWISSAWSIDDSMLVVAKNAAEGTQVVPAGTMQTPLEFVFPVVKQGQSVFRLTTGKLERLDIQPSATGMKWQVDKPAAIESFLVSSSPIVIQFVQRHLSTGLDRRAADQLEVVTYEMALAGNILNARFHERNAVSELSLNHVRRLNQAQRLIDSSVRAMRAQQLLASINLTLEAQDSVHAVLHETYHDARAAIASPQSSPLLASPAALGMHWQLADACQRSTWQNTLLPGSDFVNLQGMLEAGWSQQRRLEEQADLRVELVPTAKPSTGGLRLAAYAKKTAEPLKSGFAGASLRVRSAGVQVKAGQLLRVTGTASVVSGSNQGGTGMLVYDNQVGPSLGQLIHGKDGEKLPVELYRFAVEDGEFRILAECRGECDIVLEDIRVDAIRPATNRQSYSTSPLQSPEPISATELP